MCAWTFSFWIEGHFIWKHFIEEPNIIRPFLVTLGLEPHGLYIRAPVSVHGGQRILLSRISRIEYYSIIYYHSQITSRWFVHTCGQYCFPFFPLPIFLLKVNCKNYVTIKNKILNHYNTLYLFHPPEKSFNNI